MTDFCDPLAKSRCGGTERELEAIASYSKTIEGLEPRRKKERGRDVHSDEKEADGLAPGGKAKGKANKS